MGISLLVCLQSTTVVGGERKNTKIDPNAYKKYKHKEKKVRDVVGAEIVVAVVIIAARKIIITSTTVKKKKYNPTTKILH